MNSGYSNTKLNSGSSLFGMRKRIPWKGNLYLPFSLANLIFLLVPILVRFFTFLCFLLDILLLQGTPSAVLKCYLVLPAARNCLPEKTRVLGKLLSITSFGAAGHEITVNEPTIYSRSCLMMGRHDFSTLWWCSDVPSVENILWIVIFSQDSDLGYVTASWCWTAAASHSSRSGQKSWG